MSLFCAALSISRPSAPNAFDNVMPDVVKCINHVRSKELNYQQSRMFLEEIQSAQ